MKVFVSWSGNRSKVVAASLSKWLPDVFQDLTIWMSAHNIDAGQRWGRELDEQLASTSFGILCLTPENISSAWLLFEAGALSKMIGEAKVVPYLFQLLTTDVPYPLAQFQGVEATSEGTLDLLRSINSSLERALPPDRLERLFQKWWPDLESALKSVPADPKGTSTQQRSERALLEEVLQTVRNLSRVSSPTSPSTSLSTTPNVDVWRGISVWNVTEAILEGLTIDELNEFRDQAYAASMAAYPDAKEVAIERKIALADEEIAKRKEKLQK